jgi:signal transduction histidine kinase/ligand-binding sensor domain-containing protein
MPNDIIRISSLLADKRGRVWAGTWNGLLLLKQAPRHGDVIERSWLRVGPLPHTIQTLFRSRDGRLWAMGNQGLAGWDEASAEPTFHSYDDPLGLLTSQLLYGMAEDPQGSLWVLTEAGGVIRLLRNGISQFGTGDGLLSPSVLDIIQDHHNAVLAVTRPDGLVAGGPRYLGTTLNKFTDGHFVPLSPLYPHTLDYPGWGERQIAFQSRFGEWWFASGRGLFRFPAVPLTALAQTEPLAVYRKSDGLPSDDIFCIAEDLAGNVWIGTMAPGTLSMWERSSNKIVRLDRESSARSLAGDSQGDMWLGRWMLDGLSRYSHGKLETFTQRDGLPPGRVTDIIFDHQRRLWLTLTEGLAVADHPFDRPLKFRTFTTQNGLANRYLHCIVEGLNHHFYIGSEKGIDELDDVTGRIRHFGMRDGLPNEQIFTAARDAQGVLWFGTHRGLVRMQPESRAPAPADVTLRLLGLRVAGQRWPISKLGETRLNEVAVDYDHNLVEINFADLAFGAAGLVRYQYQLGPSQSGWSPPSFDRTLTLAGLSPGAYHLQVRAVDTNGSPLGVPIVIDLLLRPPFWQAWWFQLTVFLTLAGLLALIYHYRVSRLLALQKMRARIANDLHDDVGSGLSQIAIWSDIAIRDEQDRDALQRIAVSSRSLVDNIGDIVWTVNPRRDTLRQLISRIRYYASEVCSARNIALRFQTPDGDWDREANSEVRHDLFLLAKEAIYNAARHSGCTELKINVEVSSGSVDIRIADNGCGMNPAGKTGNGISSMRQRARQLNARLEWLPGHPTGTTVHCHLPLRSASLLFRRKDYINE